MGRAAVLAAHAVIIKAVPPYSVVAGIPGKVIRNRIDDHAAGEERRRALADIARKTASAVRRQEEIH